MNITGLTGNTDSRLRRTSDRSLDRIKGSLPRKHEFSVVIGGQADEDKQSFNAAIAKYDKLNLEKEYAIALSKNEATSSALVPIKEEEIRSKYHITNKQHENLKKLFKFYSAQHQTQNLRNYTFEDYEKQVNRMVIGDYNWFCKDFDIPLSKDDQKEVFRKRSIRTNNAVTFEKFQDIL